MNFFFYLQLITDAEGETVQHARKFYSFYLKTIFSELMLFLIKNPVYWHFRATKKM